MTGTANDGSHMFGPPAAVPTGIVIGGKFTLLRLIAEGGVGAVYEAEDALICRRVALKLLHPHYSRHPDAVRRFRREAQATASIDHPNVVTVLEMGSCGDGTFFIVQELLKGQNLRERLAERRRLDMEEALQILLPVADALSAAHRRGIVHRDVKPENIVLARTASSEIVPKLIDFGIARMRPPDGGGAFTRIGVTLGTPAYMSPEQVRAESPVDGRCDVWALATVLFEVLSGRCPYEGPTEGSILAKILTAPAPRLGDILAGVPGELSDIVTSGLERDPEKRPWMHTWRDMLMSFVEGRGRALPVLSARPEAAGDSTVTELPESEIEDVIDIDPDDLLSVDEERSPAWIPTSVLETGTHPEMEWAHDRGASQPEVERAVSLTEDALRINALEDTIRCADEAIRGGVADDLLARLRLNQSIACFWLGHYFDAETYALQAMQKLPPGTTGWYAALGHVVMAAGHRGRTDQIDQLSDQVARAPSKGTPAFIVATCRIAVQLVRTGSPDRARRILEASDRVTSTPSPEPFVRAWRAVAGAELAVHDGDPMTYMELVRQAVDDFVAANDIRNASLQRSNIGNAYLQLGGYKQAERILDEALATAEPMKLSFAAAVRANLGFALARLGQLDQALEVELTALEQCIRQGNVRSQVVARIYLASIYTSRGDVELARRSAETAVELADGIPALRAYALALLANLLLNQDRPTDGLKAARLAMGLLSKLEGVEEGESLIRLVYASAMAQTGNLNEMSRHIRDARERLRIRAERITDPRWRETFLRNVPENAQTLAFASRWVDGGDK